MSKSSSFCLLCFRQIHSLVINIELKRLCFSHKGLCNFRRQYFILCLLTDCICTSKETCFRPKTVHLMTNEPSEVHSSVYTEPSLVLKSLLEDAGDVSLFCNNVCCKCNIERLLFHYKISGTECTSLIKDGTLICEELDA